MRKLVLVSVLSIFFNCNETEDTIVSVEPTFVGSYFITNLHPEPLHDTKVIYGFSDTFGSYYVPFGTIPSGGVIPITEITRPTSLDPVQFKFNFIFRLKDVPCLVIEDLIVYDYEQFKEFIIDEYTTMICNTDLDTIISG